MADDERNLELEKLKARRRAAASGPPRPPMWQRNEGAAEVVALRESGAWKLMADAEVENLAEPARSWIRSWRLEQAMLRVPLAPRKAQALANEYVPLVERIWSARWLRIFGFRFCARCNGRLPRDRQGDYCDDRCYDAARKATKATAREKLAAEAGALARHVEGCSHCRALGYEGCDVGARLSRAMEPSPTTRERLFGERSGLSASEQLEVHGSTADPRDAMARLIDAKCADPEISGSQNMTEKDSE